MPLYEYECAKCGERTEAIQRHGDALLTKCPNCGGKLKKLLSAPAFQFKGSGFYLTDYGKAGKTGEKEKEKEKEKISSKGEEGKGTSGSASSGGEAGGTGASDSSKGKKDGAPGAAPSSSPTPSVPAPSKKNSKGDTK